MNKTTIKSRLTAITLLCSALILFACAPAMQTTAWVVRYDMDSHEEIEKICTEAKRAELDSLLLQVRGRADAYYKSEIAPLGETLDTAPLGFDPLQETIAACQGIKLHAWLNVYYLWGDVEPPEDENHPGHPQHDWILYDKNGKSTAAYSDFDKALGWLEGAYADPASPTYREHFAAIVREIITSYPLAGIHLDFIRYPGFGFGQNGQLSKAFQKQMDIDPRLLPDELTQETLTAWLRGDQHPADRLLTTASLFWSEYRANRITQLLADVRQVIDEQAGAKKMELTVAVYPEAAYAYLDKGQDWQSWARLGLVDGLYPMAYFGNEHRVGAQLQQVATDQAADLPVSLWAGLGAYIKDTRQIEKEARYAQSNGYNGVALFSLGHLIRQHKNARAYTTRARSPFFWPQTKQSSMRPATAKAVTLPDLSTATKNNLRAILIKAMGGKVPEIHNLDVIVAQRLDEFNTARKGAFDKTLATLQAQPQELPQNVELRGIFRYANSLDNVDFWQEQYDLSHEARDLLVRGKRFDRVAAKMSRGGTRKLGGKLGRRYLDPLDPTDKALAQLTPGQISQVFLVHNGYWFYRLEKISQPEQSNFNDASWPVKRILFRKALRSNLD